MQYGRNVFRLGYGNGSIDKVHVAMLRTLETLLALPALEFRETYRMSVTEKVLVGSIKVADGVQEGL